MKMKAFRGSYTSQKKIRPLHQRKEGRGGIFRFGTYNAVFMHTGLLLISCLEEVKHHMAEMLDVFQS